MKTQSVLIFSFFRLGFLRVPEFSFRRRKEKTLPTFAPNLEEISASFPPAKGKSYENGQRPKNRTDEGKFDRMFFDDPKPPDEFFIFHISRPVPQNFSTLGEVDEKEDGNSEKVNRECRRVKLFPLQLGLGTDKLARKKSRSFVGKLAFANRGHLGKSRHRKVSRIFISVSNLR